MRAWAVIATAVAIGTHTVAGAAGFVDIVDRANSGMHIPRLTGDATRIAGPNGDDDYRNHPMPSIQPARLVHHHMVGM
jgi:hypothetical protein